MDANNQRQLEAMKRQRDIFIGMATHRLGRLEREPQMHPKRQTKLLTEAVDHLLNASRHHKLMIDLLKEIG